MDLIDKIRRDISNWEGAADKIRKKAQSTASREARALLDSDDMKLIDGLPDGTKYTHYEDILEDEKASAQAKQQAKDLLLPRGNGLGQDAKIDDPFLKTLDARDLYFALGLDGTDVDMTKRLLAVFHDKLRYSKGIGCLHWTGQHWVVEEKDDAPLFRASQEIAERMTKEAKVAKLAADAGVVDDYVISRQQAKQKRNADEKKWVVCHEDLVARAKAAKSNKVITSMTKLAENHIGIKVGELDQKPSLLTVENGTVDLVTGELLPHNPDHYMTKMSPIKVHTKTIKGKEIVHFDPAKAPVWMKAIDQAFQEDEELIDYVKRLSGYVITGETIEQKFFFLFGGGSNMKGKFVGALKSIIPEHSEEVDKDLLMKSRNKKSLGGTNEEVADLRSIRLIHSEEGDVDDVLDEASMKKLSGQGEMKAAKKYKSEIRFKPVGKILYDTNKRPRIYSQDKAIWRRVVEIPFFAHFANPGDEGFEEGVSLPKNDRLDEDLAAELPHILAWAIEGAGSWYKNGLSKTIAEPQKIIDAREAYKKDTDVLSDFIEAACEKDDDEQVRSGHLYEAYKNFCEMNSTARPISTRAFSSALGERGYGRVRRGGMIWRTGLKLTFSGERYRRELFPEYKHFTYRLGETISYACRLDDLPCEIRNVVAKHSKGCIPKVADEIDTEAGVFVRTA